jgi:hypothetical protein
MKRLSLIVVGKLSTDQSLVDPLSVVGSSDADGRIIDMDLEFRLEQPEDELPFQEDYIFARKTLKFLLGSPAIHSESSTFPNVFRNSSVRLEAGSVSFIVPLFQRRVSFVCE